jgi:WD40 repeat protein
VDSTIKIWGVKQEKCLYTLRGHQNSVTCLSPLPGRLLASGSSDNTIKIWEVRGEKCLSTLRGHKGSVTCLSPLPGGLLASGSYDHTIKIWGPKKSFWSRIFS